MLVTGETSSALFPVSFCSPDGVRHPQTWQGHVDEGARVDGTRLPQVCRADSYPRVRRWLWVVPGMRKRLRSVGLSSGTEMDEESVRTVVELVVRDLNIL